MEKFEGQMSMLADEEEKNDSTEENKKLQLCDLNFQRDWK